MFYTMNYSYDTLYVSLYIDNQMLFLDNNKHEIEELLNYKITDILFDKCHEIDDLLMLYYFTLEPDTKHTWYKLYIIVQQIIVVK